MTDRTLKIINLCKGWGKYTETTPVEIITAYMSEECLCLKEDYTYQMIEQIMLEALYDYIDTCDKPSSILYHIYNCINADTLVDRIWTAFSLVQIKNPSLTYINGFSDRFEEVRKELYFS